MLFENQQINTAELPSVEAVQFQLLPPKALRLRLTVWAILEGILFLPIVTALLFERNLSMLMVLLFWALQAAYFYWVIHKRYYREAYAVREKDLLHVRGYWRRVQLTVPYSRVQHVEIRQGPVGRWLGLGTIRVYTSGSVGGDLSISDIEFSEAERIKQFIAQKVETDV